MKNISCLFLALSLFILSGCGEKEKESVKEKTAGMTVYNDSTMGFSIEYPSKWSKDTTSNRVGFFSPDDHAAIFVSMYYNIPAGEKIEDIFENIIVQPYSQPESFGLGENLMDEEDCVWSPEIANAAGAESGYGGFFEAKVAGRDVLMLVAVLKKGATAYQILTYAEAPHYDHYRDTLQNAFASFKIGE